MTTYLSYPPINTHVFANGYTDARQRLLRQTCELKSVQHVAYVCSGETPNAETLSTDVLWIGSENAEKVFILLAGTHGIEGFVGSAVELDHINLITNNSLPFLSHHTAILFVHALTPWGYAWLRRCDEDGVDLNRNYIDFTQLLPENTGYDVLRDALFTTNKYEKENLFNGFIHEHGRTAFEIAISGGQYSDPKGPFFGGHKPTHGREVTETLINNFSLKERDLAVIDVHSGLGAYGYGEIICDHAAHSPAVDIARQWYGDSVTLPALGTSSSVPKLGLMDYAWHEIMNDNSCHVTLEFGTYPTDQLFDVLLQDHQLWAQTGNELERREHSHQMRKHFCPSDPAWQALVLFRARQVIFQALQGLSAC